MAKKLARVAKASFVRPVNGGVADLDGPAGSSPRAAVLRIWPIDRQIGQVRNDGPHLEPLLDPKRTPQPTLL